MRNNNSYNQIRLITKTTALACLAGILLSYKIWLSERSFPLSPVFDFLQIIPHPYDFILLGSNVLLLLLIIFSKNPKKLIIVFLLSAIILALFDLNRWQPWFYQYVLIFFILSFLNNESDNIEQKQAIITIFKLMFASIYFWSGLQKLNPNFISDTFPWLIEPFHIENVSSFNYLAKSFPIIESLAGIMLLINRTKKIGVVLIVLIHLFILIVIGPWGHNYNPVVWPWNVVMILYCFILFFNSEKITLNQTIGMLRYNSIKIVFVLFCILPQLNFFNLWDSYLSHNLYSGNTSNGIIVFSDSVKNNLPVYIKKYAVGENNNNSINIKYWCIQETGVPAYPEKRNFKKVISQVSKFTNNKEEIYLDYSPKLSITDLTK